MAIPIDHVFVTTPPSIIQSTLLMCTKNHLKTQQPLKFLDCMCRDENIFSRVN